MSPPPHIELSAVLRLEADYLPHGPRAELLRLAAELEADGDPVVVSCDALWDAIGAATTSRQPDGANRRPEDGATGRDADTPSHISMPPYLRRTAHRQPAGTDRDALLRYADELEEKGDPSLVSPAVLRAALKAHSAGDIGSE